MKHMHENGKFLEKYMQKVHEELKMRIKFCKQKVSQSDLVMMLLEYIDHQSKILTQGKKENQCINNIQQEGGNILQKNKEIDYLKQQIKIEAELTKSFFNQIKKNSLLDANIKLSFRDYNHSAENMSPNTMISSVNQCHATPSIEPFGDLNQKVITSPNSMIESIQIRNGKQGSARSPRISESTKTIEHQRQKSKTFARLRKVEAMFCHGQNKATSRRKSLASDSWNFANKDENKIMVQQNENLKAIQNNLVTHLSIMEKYKNIPSIEQLVQKEEKLKKKESQLKELELNLEKRERNVNKSHIEVLKKQKSIKML